jgi:hypothetical protein
VIIIILYALIAVIRFCDALLTSSVLFRVVNLCGPMSTKCVPCLDDNALEET